MAQRRSKFIPNSKASKRRAEIARLKQKEIKCWYCGLDLSEDETHIDHIVPKSNGGENEIENKALSCSFCNFAKQDKDLFTFLKWLAHVRSSSFKCFIIKELYSELDSKIFDKLQKSF